MLPWRPAEIRVRRGQPVLAKRVWLLLACFAKLGVAQTEDPREALAADDACAAGSCSLGLLQVEASQEVEGGSYWQGVRETGTTCMFSNCPGRLSPVDCHHWRCVCKEGNRYNPADGGACVPNDSASARRMTGSTCYLSGCPLELGKTQCVGHECVCFAGFEFQKGACVRVHDGSARKAVGRNGCEHHPNCAALGLHGACCPNPIGHVLQCCS
ncbi:unnamed protein product [Symbiodinium natans]|uniref:EB domain-containing protein n=1 Tax=Symbiodinium natans TaxID=878477 RepID=A0A812I8C9_9DINO|nr:unnamed protein product [Symbiodinium natans]